MTDFSWLKDKNLLRTLLIFCLVFYMPGAWSVHSGREAAAKTFIEEALVSEDYEKAAELRDKLSLLEKDRGKMV
jgi:hypothetical protein